MGGHDCADRASLRMGGRNPHLRMSSSLELCNAIELVSGRRGDPEAAKSLGGGCDCAGSGRIEE